MGTNSDTGRKSRKRLLENICLLYAVISRGDVAIVEGPMVFKPHLDTAEDPARILKLEYETKLISDLAFISSTVWDNERITAVAVEEHANHQGITIRVASNTGNLSHTLNGLRSLADVIQATSRGELDIASAHSRALTAIIELDFERILTRLRSRHAQRSRKASKTNAATLLKTHIYDISLDHERTRFPDVMCDIDQLIQQLTALDKLSSLKDKMIPTQVALDALASITEVASRVAEWPGLIQLLGKLRPEFDPVERQKSVPETIKKIGRYYEISRNLVRCAQGSLRALCTNIFIETLAATPPPHKLLRQLPESFEVVTERIRRGSLSKQKSLSIPSVTNNQAVSGKYRSLYSSENTKWKVHAEIQLAAFYDQHPDVSKPRIICASKDCCYLCKLFLECHGKFQIMGSHGRLYDKWAIPGDVHDSSVFKGFARLLGEFNNKLEDKIRQILTLKTRIAKIPNESVLRLCSPWSTPPQSISVEHPEMVQSTSQNPLIEHGPQAPPSRGELPDDMKITPGETRCPEMATASCERSENLDSILTPVDLSPTLQRDNSATFSVCKLDRGHWHFLPLGTPGILTLQTPSMSIGLLHEPLLSNQNVSVRAKWLKLGNNEEEAIRSISTIVNVAALTVGSNVDLLADAPIILDYRGSRVLIEFLHA